MGKRDHSINRIEWHFIISCNIQNFHKYTSISLDSIFYNFRFLNLYTSLAVTDLQDFPLAFLQFNTVRYAAFGVIPYQEAFQTHLFSLRNAFFQRRVHIQNQVMLFFAVKLHVQFQHRVYTHYPFFPIGIRFYFNALMHNGKANIWNHLSHTTSTLHFRIKRKHILCPLKRIFLIFSRIQDKN